MISGTVVNMGNNYSYCTNSFLCLLRCWLAGALPMVIDRETTLSDKCMETLEELILKNVVPAIRLVVENTCLLYAFQ